MLCRGWSRVLAAKLWLVLSGRGWWQQNNDWSWMVVGGREWSNDLMMFPFMTFFAEKTSKNCVFVVFTFLMKHRISATEYWPTRNRKWWQFVRGTVWKESDNKTSVRGKIIMMVSQPARWDQITSNQIKKVIYYFIYSLFLRIAVYANNRYLQ